MRRARPQPHQGSRIGQSLVESQQADHRAEHAHPLFDGDGKTKAKVEFPACTPVTIHHNLGRLPRGWLAYSPRTQDTAATDVRLVEDETARTTDSITLRSLSAADVTWDIFVF